MQYKTHQTQIYKWVFWAINIELKSPELTISEQWLWLTVWSETLQISLEIIICMCNMCYKSVAHFKYESSMWNSIFQGYFCATQILSISHITIFKVEFSGIYFALYIYPHFINRKAYNFNNLSQRQEHKEGHKKNKAYYPKWKLRQGIKKL